MTPAHERMAELVGLLPYSRAEVAQHLGVSLPTLQGWLRAAREPLTKRQPGYAPPSVAALRAAQALLIDHTTECQDALAKDTTMNTYDSLADALKAAGPTHHIVETSSGFVLTDGTAATLKLAVAANPSTRPNGHINDALQALEQDLNDYEGEGPALVTYAAGWWTVAPAESGDELDGVGFATHGA
jgi:hypothetical protein